MDNESTTGHTVKRFPTKRELQQLDTDVRDVQATMRSSSVVSSLPRVGHDVVNHPSHYTAYQGLEVIDLTEQMNFNRGNAVKYIARAGLKNPATEVEDLEKAAWYIRREIERINNTTQAG